MGSPPTKIPTTDVLLEQAIVRHGAPTLAGIKPANLFVFGASRADPPIANFSEVLHDCRTRLAARGVRIEVLARRPSGPLLYLYRPDAVKRTIANPRVAAYLGAIGYDPTDLGACITLLHHRICGTDVRSLLSGTCAFPHEIGFFLGYPFEDVIGFIENNGKDFLSVGCWKVYSHEADARECFCRYRECAQHIKQLYEEGASLESLVAHVA